MDSVEQALSSERMLELGQRAASQLANQTYAKIKELGAERLHYRLTLFNDNTHLAEESPGVYIIWLKDEFAWISNTRLCTPAKRFDKSLDGQARRQLPVQMPAHAVCQHQ